MHVEGIQIDSACGNGTYVVTAAVQTCVYGLYSLLLSIRFARIV